MDKHDLKKEIAKLVMQELKTSGLLINEYNKVPVSVSARHLHLCKEDLEALFGKGYELTVEKEISQPGQYAAKEKVTLITDKGKIENIRVLGPLRNKTQIELTKSEARTLGLNLEVRNSGDLADTSGVTIKGPKGSIELREGVIIADRHIHMTPEDAENYGVKNGQKVSVVVNGKKGGVLSNVTIRVNPRYKLDFHIDTDDANAFLIQNGDLLELVK